MSNTYEINVRAQNSIYIPYAKPSFDRNLKVFFSTPKDGINENTGVLLLIAGFGGNASSNVYKKMRSTFADEYNLVTIQCDYFGFEFMQLLDRVIRPDYSPELMKKILPDEDVKRFFVNGVLDDVAFLNAARNYNLHLYLKTDLSGENLEYFNDMGFMQALDNIVALLNVLNIIFDNNYQLNTGRIIAYGYSHGAYLAHLCNVFLPTLFSLIVDNSAWLLPRYLEENRSASWLEGKLTISTIYEYLAKHVVDDHEALRLPFLYSSLNNNCRIIAYHGVNDELVTCTEKAAFCNELKNCNFMLIEESSVDNIVFKSTTHGLGADFLELFRYTMENLGFEFNKYTTLELSNTVVFQTKKHRYLIDYANVYPLLKVD